MCDYVFIIFRQAENASAAREKLTKGLNTFLEGISKALVVPPDDDDQIPIIAPASECYDRTKVQCQDHLIAAVNLGCAEFVCLILKQVECDWNLFRVSKGVSFCSSNSLLDLANGTLS